MDLVEFLRARLERDEQVALAGSSATGSAWTASPSGRVQTDPADDGEPAIVATAETGAYAEHIARHDPARVLREVASMRQILDDYEKDAWVMTQGRADESLRAAQSARLSMLRLLALTYSTHPAYQDDWRP